MALMLKKFCGRARALAMTGVVALLVGISTGTLTAAIIVYSAAAARLRAVFDTVTAAATAAPHSAGVSVSFNDATAADGSATGFALTVAADLACFADLLLLGVKRLAFARNREATSY
uniref:Secreted protein n=1 Tax=Macrostomum lignano TaxID=282301 RepID=A0A1I8FYL6_9PLAT